MKKYFLYLSLVANIIFIGALIFMVIRNTENERVFYEMQSHIEFQDSIITDYWQHDLEMKIQHEDDIYLDTIL